MNNNEYCFIEKALSLELCNFIYNECKIIENVIITNNPGKHDNQVYNALSHYSPICGEALSIIMKPIIEKYTNKFLIQTYSYMRIYYYNSELKKHTDRNECEYTVTVCIKQTKPWPIHISIKNEIKSFTLNVGDILIFKGCNNEHWRNVYDGEEHVQLFLHYVDINGVYSNLKYDKRPGLGFFK